MRLRLALVGALGIVLTAAPAAPAGSSSTSSSSRARERCVELTFGGVQDPRRIKRLTSPANAGLRRALAVLDRPRTASDAIPGRFSAFFPFGLAAINTRSVRYVGQTDIGERYYLVPGYTSRPPVLPARCRRLLTRAQRRAYAVQRHELATPAQRARLELFSITDDGHSTSGSIFALRDLDAGAAIDMTPSLYRKVTTFAGVVPNPVRSVEITAAGATASVMSDSNFFVASLPKRLENFSDVVVRWLDESGATIKITHPGRSSSTVSGGFNGGGSEISVR